MKGDDAPVLGESDHEGASLGVQALLVDVNVLVLHHPLVRQHGLGRQAAFVSVYDRNFLFSQRLDALPTV